MEIVTMNWPAVVLGVVLAFGLGMFWFSPMMFGKTWSTGSHNIQPPATPPVLAMAVQLLGTIAMAVMVGLTETTGAIGTAIVGILAVTLMISGMDLFSQKTGRATLVDAAYIIACGVLMIGAQAIL